VYKCPVYQIVESNRIEFSRESECSTAEPLTHATPLSLQQLKPLLHGHQSSKQRCSNGGDVDLCLCAFDRIDRSRWNPRESVSDKIDAHLSERAYERSSWDRLTPLLAALHGDTSNDFAWSLNYYLKFSRLRVNLSTWNVTVWTSEPFS